MAKVLTEARCPPRRGFFFVALGTRRKRKTGFWLEEFAAPYYHFKGAGAEIVLASPKGGQPPLDLKSNEPNFQTELTHRFETDAAVTGFTNTEEEAVGLTQVVPFLVEDELTAEGAHFSKTGDWGVHVVTDGLLITG
jgi:putative intracellular protease/amidase